MKHTVLLGDGVNTAEPLYFETEELVQFLAEELDCSINGEYMKVEIHTWENEASVEKKRAMSQSSKEERSIYVKE
jgi:hypothetical protein